MAVQSEGRDSRGRFTRGNKGGPGNPFMRKTAAMRREVAEAFEDGELRPLMRKLLEQALEGDTSAARLEYALGGLAAHREPGKRTHDALLPVPKGVDAWKQVEGDGECRQRLQSVASFDVSGVASTPPEIGPYRRRGWRPIERSRGAL
jgi:hypothetical protein